MCLIYAKSRHVRMHMGKFSEKNHSSYEKLINAWQKSVGKLFSRELENKFFMSLKEHTLEKFFLQKF